jgi:protein-L-isoaspartate(D-aspartate) O-methyltransferase
MDPKFLGIGMTSQRTRLRMIERLFSRGIKDRRVLDVMTDIPRHLFLDEALSHRAYEDTSLPIGFNQTLSQPYIVARMTEFLLAGGECSKVLEIGTGSGYQTSVLAKLVDTVYSVERIKTLQDKARKRFVDLDLGNIHLSCVDGNIGWPEHQPFDAIISTAAPYEIPKSLKEQLVEGGRLIIPVGQPGAQNLVKVIRTKGGFEEEVIEPVSFVPLLPGVVC